MIIKEIKKYIWLINTVLFLCLFIFLFIKISYLFRPVSVNRRNIVGFYAEKKDTIDVICIGGSSTYVFWAPYDAWNQEGIVSYDFSTDSMSPALIKGLMEEALKTQSPELFVIDLRALDVEEVHEGFYSDAYLRNANDSLKYSVNRIKSINYSYKIEHPELYGDISNYFDLCMYHSSWQNIVKDNYDYMNNDVTRDFKGFEFITFAFHENLPRNDYNEVDYEVELSSKTNEIFIDLLKYCKNHNLNVLFTLNPICIQTPETKARYNYINRVVNEYGFSFLNTNDYYDEMGIDFSHDFYHKDHVNYYGAQKYTSFLAGYIKEHYSIPDRRKDSKYVSWNDGYPNWVEATRIQKELIDEAITSENNEQ